MRSLVFHGNATRADVYDPDSLRPLASIEVGMGASHAFGLADPADAGRFGKFYVVSPAAVAIFDGEFERLGEIFLEGPMLSPVAAASLAYDGRRLLIAAGKRLIVIDTGTDQIIASPEPGFVVSSIAATRDNQIVYVMSAESGYVREFDVAANTFSSNAYLLPSAGTVLAVAPDGETVYAAVSGSVFDLRSLPRLPLPSSGEGTPSLVTSRPDPSGFGSPDAEGPYRLGTHRSLIDKLLVSYGGRYVMRVGGKWFEGSLKDAEMLRPMTDPRSGLPFGPETAAIAMVSPRQVFAAVGEESTLVRFDPTDPESAREVKLSSAPVGLALTSPTPTQNTGSLEQVAGDGAVIAGGGGFELTVRATGANGFPQSQAVVFASDITPSAAQCISELTDGNGEATLYCVSEPTESTLFIEVTLSDDAGRTAPAFGIRVLPTIEFEGVEIVDGDDQIVGQEGAFQLVVAAARDGLVDAGAVLDVDVELDDDPVEVACPAQVTTDEQGMAVIACTSGEFDDSQLTPEAVKGTITVSNDRGSSVVFRITIDPAITSLNTGLFKVSGDNQIVQQGRPFPLPLVVRSIIDGEPQAMEQLTVSTDPRAKVFCPIFAVTDEEGIASIQCRADTVTRELLGKVLVVGPQLRSALFNLRIIFLGGGLAVDVDFVNASPFEGKVGEPLVDAVTARALGSSGEGVAGAEVFFFSENDVTFDPPSAVSDACGDATTTVVLGCNAKGEGELKAGLADGVEMDKLRFESEAGELAGLFKVQGDNQSGSPGQRLSRALLIRTGDVCENGIAKVPLRWRVLPEPRATMRNVFQRSNNFGDASAIVTMGAYGGPFQIAVESGRFRAVFDLTTTLDATSLVRLSGDQQSVMAGQYAAQPLVVEVRGSNGFGVSGVDVDFAVTQGAATLTETSVKTDGLGVAFTRLHSTEEGAMVVTASAIDQSVTFHLGTGVVGPNAPVEGFVNGASFLQGWTPGSLGSLFLSGLLGNIDGVVIPEDFPFPTTLEGVQIKVNGVPAPLIALININGAEQINLQVPFGFGSGQATVMVERDGLSTTVEGVPLTSVQPGIFEFTLDGQLFAAILDDPYNKLVTPSNPAAPGDVVQLFLTGLGPTDPMVGTNQPGPVPLGLPLADVAVGIDNQGVEVLGSFYAPDAITLYQINFRIPESAQPGNRKLSVVADGVASQDSLIPIQ